MSTLFAWLFDAYPSGNGMSVWLIDREGRSHELHDTFSPRFYAQGARDQLHALSEPGGLPADIDCSGVVGFGDLTLLLAAWGPCP